MAEAGVIPVFEMVPVELTAKSQEMGRPVFEDREHIHIFIAGDSRSEVFREVTDNDRQRFHEEYARFKQGIEGEGQLVGTPIKEWPALKPSEVKEFEAMGLKTVEHIADMSDHVKQRFGMGANEYQAKAKAFLEAANGSAAATKLAGENEQLKSRIDDLERQIADLSEMMESATEPAKRGPGRPPKAA